MNDYYLWVCDLESEEKSKQNDDYYWFIDDDEWLNYSYEEDNSNDWEEF